MKKIIIGLFFLLLLAGNLFAANGYSDLKIRNIGPTSNFPGGIYVSSVTFSDGSIMYSTSNFSGAGMYLPLTGGTLSGDLALPNLTATYGVSAATGVFTSGLSVITSTNASSSPATLLTFGNSGYAAPSNCDTVSNGDKWIFWNQAAYKGAIGFNTREMYFQSTNNAGSAGKFSFHNGITGSPVELLQFGEAYFVWNDTGIDTDFRCESNDDENMFLIDGTANRIGISTGAPAEVLDVIGNIRAEYGIIASSSTITKIINPVSSVQILWSTSSINCDNYNTLVVSSGSIVSVSTITAGVEGQTIKITGTSDTDIVRFITGGNLKLDVGGSFDAGNGDKMFYTYRDIYWEEDNRKDNTF